MSEIMTEKKRLLSVNEFIDNALEERCCEIENIKVIKNRRYIKAAEKVGEIYEQIRSLLSDDGKKLLIEYDDARSDVHYIESSIIYRRGLRDGLALPKAWGGTM